MKGLDEWLAATAWNKIYWSRVKAHADRLQSDGCSGVPDYLWWTCLEHDIHYRTHQMLSGDVIDRETADYIFRVRIQQGSGFGRFSPVSWWRWAAVRLFGEKAWRK